MAFKFNSKKDFGLGKHRVTLPEEESDRSDDDGSGTELPRTPEAKRSTDASSSLLSTISGRVKSLFGGNKSDQGSSPSLNRQSPLLKEKSASGHEPDLISLDVENCSSGRPSPSLHSRVVNKDHLFAASGVKGSLDSLKDRYGLTDDDDSAAEDSDECIWKIVLKSENSESSKQVSLKKTSEGLGIRLSNGQPPIYVTQVEPDSEAMLAGIQIGDTIVEINGKNCRELESTEVSRLLQLKSLIKNNSPHLSNMRKCAGGIPLMTLIDDSDTEGSDVETLNTATHDKVSIDEQLFEYLDKEKIEPMPLLREEDSPNVDTTQSNTEELLEIKSTDSNPQGPISPPVAKSRMNALLDFTSIPTTERLGGDVGRYKRDIGNARRRKPTRRPQSTIITSSEFGLVMEPEEKMRSRTLSTSSRTSESGDKPVPKPKPPVALRRKSGSRSSLELPSDEEKAQRRFTIDSLLGGQGQNTHLLAEAASARAKLRSSGKDKTKSDSSMKILKEEENLTQADSDKPSWITLAKNKHENASLKSSLPNKDQTSKDDHSNAKMMTETKSISPKDEKKSVSSAKPPPKPLRAKNRSLEISEHLKKEDLSTTDKKTNDPVAANIAKPIPIPRKPSTGNKTNQVPEKKEISATTSDQLETKPATEPKEKLDEQSKLNDVAKPTPTPRKPSIGNKEKQQETTTGIEESKSVITKPLPISRKPSIGKDKPQQEINKLTKDTTKEKEDTTKEEEDKVAAKTSEQKKPVVSSIKSRMAMFEQR